MKWRKAAAVLFLVLAVLLSDLMCAAVAFNYVDMVWGIRYAGYSAPPSTAFRLFIPFGIAIGICLLTSWLFWRSSRKMQGRGDGAEGAREKKPWREKEAFMGRRAQEGKEKEK